MNILLTSFAFTVDVPLFGDHPSMFFRMPPVCMRGRSDPYIPDYAVLILSEKIIMDEISYYYLTRNTPYRYESIAKTMTTLHDVGYIELVNYGDILNQYDNLLNKMLESDLKPLEQWYEPLKKSISMWLKFCLNHNVVTKKVLAENIRNSMKHLVDILKNELHSHWSAHSVTAIELELIYLIMRGIDTQALRDEKIFRNNIRKILKVYLRYVNANLIISNHLNTGFFDWFDLMPFYRKKFLAVGHDEVPEYKKIEHSHKLFDISFPEFKISDVNELIKALNDSRVKELRTLVDKAVEGKIKFDNKFARKVFSEVFFIEKKAKRSRRIISYLTSPIGFLPVVGTPVQKLLEESVGTVVEDKIKEKYRWFYMLSDIVGKKYR